MISAKLVQLIEDHSDTITDRVVREIRHHPRMHHIGRLPETELRDVCQDVLKRLGHWLLASREDEVARHFEAQGRVRAKEKVPLHEVVNGSHILKERMLDYVRDQGIAQTSVELYAEEELEHQIGVFFDAVVYHVVKGYEEAFTLAAAAAR